MKKNKIVAEPTFTTTEVCKILGIKYGRLRGWMMGYIAPAVQSGGQRARFTVFDIYITRLFMFLVDSGLSREVAADRVSGYTPEQFEKDPIEHIIVFVKLKDLIEEVDAGIKKTIPELQLNINFQPGPCGDGEHGEGYYRDADGSVSYR